MTCLPVAFGTSTIEWTPKEQNSLILSNHFFVPAAVLRAYIVIQGRGAIVNAPFTFAADYTPTPMSTLRKSSSVVHYNARKDGQRKGSAIPIANPQHTVDTLITHTRRSQLQGIRESFQGMDSEGVDCTERVEPILYNLTPGLAHCTVGFHGATRYATTSSWARRHPWACLL